MNIINQITNVYNQINNVVNINLVIVILLLVLIFVVFAVLKLSWKKEAKERKSSYNFDVENEFQDYRRIGSSKIRKGGNNYQRYSEWYTHICEIVNKLDTDKENKPNLDNFYHYLLRFRRNYVTSKEAMKGSLIATFTTVCFKLADIDKSESYYELEIFLAYIVIIFACFMFFGEIDDRVHFVDDVIAIIKQDYKPDEK